jgi:hypothetical protein
VRRSCRAPAITAQADYFHRLRFHAETHAFGAGEDRIADAVLLQFDGDVAFAADEELALVRVLGVAATDEGVE